MIITLLVLVDPANHALAGHKETRRYIAGDIVDVWDYRRPTNLGPKFVQLHCADFPDVTLDQIKSKLLRSDHGFILADDGSMVVEDVIRRRRWHVALQLMPLAAHQKLLADREMDVTFAQLKQLMRKKTVIDRNRPDLDDISVQLSRADL